MSMERTLRPAGSITDQIRLRDLSEDRYSAIPDNLFVLADKMIE